MTTDLLSRARAGDGPAFEALTVPYHRELLAHCYRMLGTVPDAEDALQDTLVAAWQGLGGFGGRASLRTWLYRIATNKCLNAMRTVRRRPAKAWDVPGIEPPEPTRLGEVAWLGPLADAWPGDGQEAAMDPAPRHERRESISLAFVTALQLLPPRQLAVLVLRDVLEFPASEVAAMLDASVPSVNSALGRARTSLERNWARWRVQAPAPAPGSPAEHAILARFVHAYETADVAALVALLTDDVFVSMPPMPLEYVGREPATRFFRLLLVPGREYRLVPVRANGGPAFGAYMLRPDGIRHASGLFVVTLSGDSICALTRFEAGEFARFGLPATLPEG
jgi:RNA polymerase sigma-70 factor (ECF subfamily)